MKNKKQEVIDKAYVEEFILSGSSEEVAKMRLQVLKEWIDKNGWF